MGYSDDERQLLRAVGDRVRATRRRRGMSQEALALESGLDRTYVGSVERGKRNIAVINLAKIARALGVSLGEILHDL